jgi:hypothetical protein
VPTSQDSDHPQHVAIAELDPDPSEKKTLIPSVLLILYDFLSLKMMLM